MSSLRFVLCLFVAGVLVASVISPVVGPIVVPVSAQGDLDAFMQQVLARRDDNWRKLQQYVLDERETMRLRGPAHMPLWGEQRDYTWYIRDGFFVRSPLEVNGVSVGDSDRRKYEAEFLAREQRRERRAAEPQDDPRDGHQRDPASAVPPSSSDVPRDLDGLLRQTQQPQFISSAYFLRFTFDQGRYALVGRELLDDREVLRIEYYPTTLFSEGKRRERERADRRGDRRRESDRGDDEEMLRLMNKTSKVTLWIAPASHQILKYVFDDLGWDFFPAQWLVRMSDISASMTVAEAFPDVWLPRRLEMHGGMLMASGAVDLDYSLDYHDYRQPDVTTTIGIPGQR